RVVERHHRSPKRQNENSLFHRARRQHDGCEPFAPRLRPAAAHSVEAASTAGDFGGRKSRFHSGAANLRLSASDGATTFYRKRRSKNDGYSTQSVAPLQQSCRV